jgi:hypothetical protein
MVLCDSNYCYHNKFNLDILKSKFGSVFLKLTLSFEIYHSQNAVKLGKKSSILHKEISFLYIIHDFAGVVVPAENKS